MIAATILKRKNGWRKVKKKKFISYVCIDDKKLH